MIHFVTRIDSAGAVTRLQAGVRREFPEIRLLTYEELFHTRRAPVGHYVFTDQDRLSTYEVEVARSLALALQNADAKARILNFPGLVLERFPLLRELERNQWNQFSVTRLDDGARPKRYPVFVRCEDYHEGADTGLLYTAEELEQALTTLQRQGKVLKRRIAVEFCAEQTPAGLYRKHGAINIHGEIIPQHIIESEQWQAKAGGGQRIYSESSINDELAFIESNPQQDELRRIFEMAHIDYGRADYGIVNGRIQIYEINTNPYLPRLHEEAQADRLSQRALEIRRQRRQLLHQAIVAALKKVNVPLQATGTVSFPLPQWKYHELRSLSPRSVRMRRWREGCLRSLAAWRDRHPAVGQWMPGRSALRKWRGRSNKSQ